MSEPQPFVYDIRPPETEVLCIACRVYSAELVVLGCSFDGQALALCRVCLRRLRATLKAGYKDLPPLPKRVHPGNE